MIMNRYWLIDYNKHPTLMQDVTNRRKQGFGEGPLSTLDFLLNFPWSGNSSKKAVKSKHGQGQGSARSHARAQRPGPYLAVELVVKDGGCPPGDLGEHPGGAHPREEDAQGAEAVHQLVREQLRVVQYVASVCGGPVAFLAAVGLRERTGGVT